MSAINPQGNEKYWFNGSPFTGLKDLNNTGEEKYWYNGSPIDFLMGEGSTAKFFIMF